MDIRSLRTFISVVENRGFANAADALHYSQPTVSAHIASLEEDLGVELFHRDRRPVELTPPGAALLPHARAILNQMEAARGDVSDFLGAKRGTVRLGTYPSATAGYIPTLLDQFREVYPLVDIHLVELGGAYMEQAAIAGDVNLFLRQTTPPLSSVKFESLPLWQEDFKVVFRPEHELAKTFGPIPPDELLRHRLIMTGRYQTEGILTHPFWHHLGEPPKLAFEVSQPQSLIELVRSRQGVGVTTALALHVSRVDNLIVRAIDDPLAVRDVCLYWPKNRALSVAARTLRDFMYKKASIPSCARPAPHLS
ncbi:LysR family transcriptional regulator [Nitratireductor indicus]|uniref:DNA-binding transcriptional regulator CynR n=1 Tax=Nitratireductor indicus C115 TaxID=1231190 RepID=K2PNK0_9HYPH|nr:LysR family transcriptional regulator [Nitratireductor indicus]EKF42612.1 DNA-binding transcriptional regulator CynR [Nitratireductor indicus C115]MDS1138101.1 LysR family transcriptional regulator [Nitratireductor indicus]SFQ57878.1 DNA-binding transcriptional regulator, LysR family [Nitratireductor indicus]